MNTVPRHPSEIKDENKQAREIVAAHAERERRERIREAQIRDGLISK